MFTPRERLLCGSVWALLTLAAVRIDPLALWLTLPGPVFLTWGYFRYGAVTRAFHAYYAREWTDLRAYLDHTVSRRLLSAQTRAYFDLLEGVWALYASDPRGARTPLSQVDPRLLRTDNIRSKLECHRAEAALGVNDIEAARAHLAAARALAHESSVDDWIRALEARAA